MIYAINYLNLFIYIPYIDEVQIVIIHKLGNLETSTLGDRWSDNLYKKCKFRKNKDFDKKTCMVSCIWIKKKFM